MYMNLCMFAYYCCRYGLIIPSKSSKSKPAVNPVSVFSNDDDDGDDDQVCTGHMPMEGKAVWCLFVLSCLWTVRVVVILPFSRHVFNLTLLSCLLLCWALTCGTCQHNTHTLPFNGPLSRTTQVSGYQKGKTNLDFTEARDSEWQWHQLGHMQVCTALQADNHASTPPLKFFTGWMPFLPPNQQRQSTEGYHASRIKEQIITKFVTYWKVNYCCVCSYTENLNYVKHREQHREYLWLELFLMEMDGMVFDLLIFYWYLNVYIRLSLFVSCSSLLTLVIAVNINSIFGHTLSFSAEFSF